MSKACSLQPGAVAVVAGLFKMTAEEPALLGSRCRACGIPYFPTAEYCRNSACTGREMDACRLPSAGKLYSFTVQRYQPPPLFRIDDWSPYAIGVVDLEDGLQVMGMIDGVPLDAIRIGMALRLALAPLFADAESGATLTYKFVPDDAAGDRL